MAPVCGVAACAAIPRKNIQVRSAIFGTWSRRPSTPNQLQLYVRPPLGAMSGLSLSFGYNHRLQVTKRAKRMDDVTGTSQALSLMQADCARRRANQTGVSETPKGPVKLSETIWKRMAGTTGLEFATSAVTEYRAIGTGYGYRVQNNRTSS